MVITITSRLERGAEADDALCRVRELFDTQEQRPNQYEVWRLRYLDMFDQVADKTFVYNRFDTDNMRVVRDETGRVLDHLLTTDYVFWTYGESGLDEAHRDIYWTLDAKEPNWRKNLDRGLFERELQCNCLKDDSSSYTSYKDSNMVLSAMTVAPLQSPIVYEHAKHQNSTGWTDEYKELYQKMLNHYGPKGDRPRFVVFYGYTLPSGGIDTVYYLFDRMNINYICRHEHALTGSKYYYLSPCSCIFSGGDDAETIDFATRNVLLPSYQESLLTPDCYGAFDPKALQVELVKHADPRRRLDDNDEVALLLDI